MVPRPPVRAPRSDALRRAHGWTCAGSCAGMSRSLCAQRGRVSAAEMGLRGALLPTPFLAWLTPELLNHTPRAPCGLVILPSSLPPCFGVTVLNFGFLADAIRADDSLWQAGVEEAGCASLCPAVCCRTRITTNTFSGCHQSWGPGSVVLVRGSGHTSPTVCSRNRQESHPRVCAWWL